MENNASFFPAISRANRAMATARQQEDVRIEHYRGCTAFNCTDRCLMNTNKACTQHLGTQAQEAQSDEYIKSLEAGAGVMPMPDVADEETQRLTAAVQAGLKQASERASTTADAARSAENGVGQSSATPAEASSAPDVPSSYPATLDRPEPSAEASPDTSPPGYVVVSEGGVEGAVVQQVQSIAAAGVAQSRSAVRQLQQQLDAQRQA